MIFPEGQPIIFEPYSPTMCQCDGAVFRLLAKQEDICQFQVKIAPCSGTENVLCNPLFSSVAFHCNNWQTSGGWVMDDSACCEEATGTITQFESLVIGNTYQCELVVTSIIGTMYVYNGATLIATIETSGLNVFTFTAVSQDISMVIDDDQYSVCIQSLSARYVSEDMSFGIINSAGSTIGIFSVSDNPEYFRFVKDSVTITFQWSDFDVVEGQCYTIGFADGCTNTNGQLGLFNGNFNSCLSGWTVTQGTIPTIECEPLENPETGDVENAIQFSNSGTGNIVNIVTDLKVGLSYEVTVTAMSQDADGLLRIYCGTAFDDFTTSGDTNNIICTGNTVFKIEAILNSASYVRLWEVTIKLTNLTDTEFDYESHPFKVGGNECTHLINLSNDDDAFGMVFVGANFAPQLRIESEILNHKTETIKESYHDNLGKKEVHFGETRFIVFLNTEYVPPWVGLFLSICNIADHFFVDGTEYFIEQDELEPNYPENVCFSNMASYQIPISKKTQLFRNADIGNDSTPITYSGTVYLTDNNDNVITDQFTNQAIEIPK